jgi:hypothetical protein
MTHTPATDAHEREAEAQGDLLAVERDESWLVWEAQSQNLPYEHRADCSPLAILSLNLTTTSRVSETPGSSLGFSWPMRR